MPAFLQTIRFYIFVLITVTMTTARAMPLEGDTAVQTWGEWSEWTTCSRTCGTGISTQTRSCLINCNNGVMKEMRYQSCCIQDCPVKYVSEENQCMGLELPGNWTSISTGSHGCTITCKKMTSDPSNLMTVQVTAALGKACQTDFGGKGFCLGTHCAPVGCNNILGSEEVQDKCLQCSSVVGKECYSISREVSVSIQPLAVTAAVKSPSGEWIFQGGKNGSTFKAAGTQFCYMMHSSVSGDREELLAAGPLESTLNVQLHGMTMNTINSLDLEHVSYTYSHLQTPAEPLVRLTSHTHNTTLLENESDSQLFYMWQYVSLSQCSVTCGHGMQTFVARCVDRDFRKRLLVDAFCLQKGLKKPLAVVKLCHTQDCPPMWVSRSWSICSQECGGGTQTRQVECQKFEEEGSRPNVFVNESRCGLVSKPAVQRACNTDECHAKWIARKWTPCPDHMSEGLQYRDIECCLVTSGSVTDHTHCKADLRPPSVRNCRLKNCVNGRCCGWVPNNWTKCNTDCGFGSQSRNIHCQFIDNKTMASTSCCAGLEEPEREQQCWATTGAGCTPTWLVGNYGECTGSCCDMDNQLQQRLVQCIANLNSQPLLPLPDEACSGPKPSIHSPCRRTDCPHWNTTDWGACSPPVAPTCGLKTREVQCVNADRVVERRECCHEQPLEAESCYPCDLSTPPPPLCEGEDKLDSCENLLQEYGGCANGYLVQLCCATCLSQERES